MQCNDGEEALNLIRTALHGSWAKSYIINNPEQDMPKTRQKVFKAYFMNSLECL